VDQREGQAGHGIQQAAQQQVRAGALEDPQQHGQRRERQAQEGRERPAFARFLEDSREVAAQLKLASIEVRHSPWKLLYQPKPGEVAHENLYDAARSFAIATDDLRSVSEGLKASVERMPGRLEQDAKFRTELQKQVIDAMTRYEEAQRRLYDVLNAPASQGGEGR